MGKFNFASISWSDTPKYRQLIDAITYAVAEDKLHVDDALPSVNQVCEQQGLSRDTVFKAYSILKKRGIIKSVPNKGYFVAKETQKVFLLLDTFKAYKEVLYDTFVKYIPKNVIADVHFHHYNIDVFKTLIHDSIGKYSKFIIMPFNNKKIEKIIATIPDEKLLLIDWNIHTKPSQNILYQDFGISLEQCLEEALSKIRKYDKFNLLYPDFTHHPVEAVTHFEIFCRRFNIVHSVIRDPETFEVQANEAYLSVSDRMLSQFLKQCEKKGFELGVDTGILSYNETPMKQFINKGISVISTDFELLGKTAAKFVSSQGPLRFQVPTALTLRASI